MSIQPLPPEVVAQIRSSISITSLNGVVLGLLKNSLDAGASKISININYAQGSCSIEDDGAGILPSEFHESGGLGKSFHTSKMKSSSLHGYTGTFIASLSALALVTITSRHQAYISSNTLTMHQSSIVERQNPSRLQNGQFHLSHGTKVVVRDLFGNMPVRIKQRAISAEKQCGHAREWEGLRQRLVSLLLAWPVGVSLTLCNDETQQKLTRRLRSSTYKYYKSMALPETAIVDVLSQAKFISPEEKTSWVPVNASTAMLTIDGIISLSPSPSRAVQFISLGITPIDFESGVSVLHDEVNRIFQNSDFGEEETASMLDTKNSSTSASRYENDRLDTRGGSSSKKGINRHPQFSFRITIEASQDRSRLQEDVFHNPSILEQIIETIQAMLFAFLTKCHFRPRVTRARRSTEMMFDTVSTAAGGIEKKLPPRIAAKETPSTDLDLKHSENAKGESSASDTRLPDSRRLLEVSNLQSEIWSRVKMGTSLHLRGAAPDRSPDSALQRPRSAPPGSATYSRPMESFHPSSTALDGPMLSNDGKLLRMPFLEVMPASPYPKPDAQVSESVLPQAPTHSNSANTSGGRRIWVNPITKERSLVDIHTGHTVQSTDTSDTVIPKLTNSKTSISDRSSRTVSKSVHVKSPWLSEVFRTWENPVFRPAEQEISQISFDGASEGSRRVLHNRGHVCAQIDIDTVFKEASATLDSRISKNALQNGKVISQLDNKYILVQLGSGSQNEMLVIIDQHAADERIRVESLLRSLFTPLTDSGATLVTITDLTKPIIFDLSSTEFSMLQDHCQYFARWGITCDFTTSSAPNNHFRNNEKASVNRKQVTVTSLPTAIYERCKQEPKVLIDMIRRELWEVHQNGTNGTVVPVNEVHAEIGEDDWIRLMHTCPRGIIDMLNSRACRSAIMFNDVLTRAQCEALVKRLSDCRFPFQCAHGRPSLVPLIDMRSIPFGLPESESQSAIEFATRYASMKAR